MNRSARVLKVAGCVGLAAVMLMLGSCGGQKDASDTGESSVVRKINGMDHLNKVVESAGDRLIMLDLYADWCMPCKILSPRLEQIAAENRDRVDVYKIDVDKHPGIARAFGVRGIPYVVLLKNKQVVQAFTGVQPKEAYVRAIHSHS